jgi:phage baseplate assembly protein W
MTTSAAQKMNCLWPLQRGSKGWTRAALAPRYEAAIHNLVRTPLGSLPWNPGYGSTLYRLRTQGSPYGEITGGMLMELQAAFGRWIPDVALLGVSVQMLPQKQLLEVLVVWGIPGVGSRGQLALGPVKTKLLM